MNPVILGFGIVLGLAAIPAACLGIAVAIVHLGDWLRERALAYELADDDAFLSYCEEHSS